MVQPPSFGPPSIGTLRSAHDPVEALRGEQSELESWIRESTAALEAMHDELAEWQRDLARQQAALDQREASVADAELSTASDELAALTAELEQARADVRRLENERAEQQQSFGAELGGIRQLLERHSRLLESLGAAVPADADPAEPTADAEAAAPRESLPRRGGQHRRRGRGRS
jgi:chromosome segregation ATPase